MSFLNPVNEPVLRFKSTDAGAPQINYNARVAGDVKTVLKACLVTGYGDKASAGWSIVNEVNHVAEFVSPAVAMSDYRLGIDDTSASSTTWYYQYQDAQVNPIYNKPVKDMQNIDKVNSKNGWQLLVTDLGIYFIEVVYSTPAADTLARVTYWGQIKSALDVNIGKNIAFFNVGWNGQVPNTQEFYTNSSGSTHYSLSNLTSLTFSSANLDMLKTLGVDSNTSVELISPLYLHNGGKLTAQQSGLLLSSVNSSAELVGLKDIVFDGRPAYRVCMSYHHANLPDIENYARVFIIFLDYWEY